MRSLSNNNVRHIISRHTLLYKVTLYIIGILASSSSSYSVLLCHFLSSQIPLLLRTIAPEMQISLVRRWRMAERNHLWHGYCKSYCQI